MHSESTFPAKLVELAWHLADVLQRTQTRIVFAESCTAGLVSASLATVPGISKWLCGSAVTYQEATKVCWINVSSKDLTEFSAVSEQVASSMATGVLQITPHADIAISVTGHLGPGAPPEMDAVIFVGSATQDRKNALQASSGIDSGGQLSSCIDLMAVDRIVLNEKSRQPRQAEAAMEVLRIAATKVGMRK